MHAGLDAIVATALTDRYDMAAPVLTRVGGGQNTVNLRAQTGGREVFVKTYPASADLSAERGAIGLSERASAHGVPVAPLIRNRDREVVDTQTAVACSVWEWMPGHVVTDLDDAHYVQAGSTLGRIHQAFADLPYSTEDRHAVLRSWRSIGIIVELVDYLARRVLIGPTHLPQQQNLRVHDRHQVVVDLSVAKLAHPADIVLRPARHGTENHGPLALTRSKV